MSDTEPNEALTDEQSFLEMIEGLAAMRPHGQRRHFPRFPTAAALAGELSSREFDGRLFADGEVIPADVDPVEIDPAETGFERGVHIVDFSERGFQLQFQCEGFARFLNHRLSLDIQSARIPVRITWCKHTPPLGRGGVSIGKGVDGRQSLMGFIAGLGEELVRFLLEGFKTGSVKAGKQAGVFTFFALCYALRLHFLKALGSVAESAKNEEDIEILQPILKSILEESGVRPSRLISDDSREPELDRLSSLFMKLFHDFGCVLMGTQEDCLFLERDARAVVMTSILVPRKARPDRNRILARFRALYQGLAELRKLFPGVFDHAQFDLQFGHYSSLILQLESLVERIRSKSRHAPNPLFPELTPTADPTQPDPTPSAGLIFLEPGTPRSAGSGKAASASPEIAGSGDNTVRVFTHAGRPVSITCPKCETAHTLQPERITGLSGSRGVQCACGASFNVFFERRRTFRKNVSLHGECSEGAMLESRPMLVKDLSMGGLCFELLGADRKPLKVPVTFSPGAVLHVQFQLGDAKRSPIRAEVTVRSTQGTNIRAEFTPLDGQSKKDLGFFFMV